MIRFSMVSYNSVKGSSQVYMTNIVHHKKRNKSNDFKGQMISKCPFGVFKSSKKQRIFFQDFCPSI